MATRSDEVEQPLDVRGDRRARTSQVLVGVTVSERSGLHVEPGRHIPMERVMRRGLVGDEVEALAATCELRDDLSCIRDQAHGQRLLRGGRTDVRERFVERGRRLVQVPGLEPAFDP